MGRTSHSSHGFSQLIDLFVSNKKKRKRKKEKRNRRLC